MRNLKRALSLALASVMVLGLMVVGSGASYKDVSSEQNQEAIEVLQAVGIMVGDDNGNFNPDQKVTRNEMAVVMSNLMDYRVASYAGTSPFVDVPAWAEPYVAACWTNGITSGYTATTYGGSDSVTTAQAALMLMKALGYFQYQSDFADDWQLATVSQGNKIDLFDSVESGVREAMTRNDLAQLVLNTLEAGMVEADNDVINVNAPGVSVEAGKVTYNYVTSAKSYARAISELVPTSATSDTSGCIVELGEKLYNGDLKKTENTTDDFGRPATKWAYKTESIGTYGQDLILSSTAKVTLKTMYETLGSDNVKELSLKKDGDGNLAALSSTDKNKLAVYVDGVLQDTTVAACFDRNSSAGGNSGKGVLTEMFQDDDNNVTLVFTNYYVAQATADYSASKGSVAVSVKTKPATGFSSFSTLSDDDFAVEDIKDDDYLLYTYANGQVQDVYLAGIVTGEVTAYSSAAKADGSNKDFGDASGSVTLDGTKYDYAKFAAVDTSYGCGVEYTVGVNAVIVVDGNGYAYYVDDASASTGNYLYIDGVALASGLSSSVIADAYFADGTNAEITLKKIGSTNAEDLGIESTTAVDTKNGWYSYSKNSAGKYSLTAATSSAAVTVSSGKIDNGRVNLGTATSGGRDIKLNDKTVFIVKDKNDDITVYTGVSNVPDITLGSGSKVVSMNEKNDTSKAASLVFIDAGSNGSVKNASKDTLIYVLKLDNTSIDNTDNEKVYTYKVVINGEQDTIKAKELWTVGAMYEDYTIDSDGYYEAGDRFDVTDEDQTIQTIALGEIIQSGNVLTLGSNSSLVVNDETHIALIMRKDATASGNTTMRNEIMDDKNADFEVEAITAKNLADKFDGWDINGRAYVVYNDLSKSDLTVAVYVDVTGVAKHGDTTSVAAQDAAIQTEVETAVTGVVDLLTNEDAPLIGEEDDVVKSVEFDEVTRTFTVSAVGEITDTGIGEALAGELDGMEENIAKIKVNNRDAITVESAANLVAALNEIKTVLSEATPEAPETGTAAATVTVNVAVTMATTSEVAGATGNTVTYKLVVNFAVPAAP